MCGFYSGYLDSFYASHPGLTLRPFGEQKLALQRDAFGWAGAWSAALPSHGYEVQEIYAFVPCLDAAWARENPVMQETGSKAIDSAAAQARAFQPEVLFFDHSDPQLLAALKRAVPTIRLAIGWEGSALAKSALWREFDLMLSCAPESVDRLRAAGLHAEHLDHAFSKPILSALHPAIGRRHLTFIGQILRASDLHLRRERILEGILDSGLPLSILSPSAEIGVVGSAKGVARIGLYGVHQALRRLGMPDVVRRALPRKELGDPGVQRPLMPVSRKLARRLSPAMFGISMYQAIRDSAITLNIHADSSPTHASNMRLFEITGAASCMLTDWKENLPKLFEPDREVVVYRSMEECIEKARWLLDHPVERASIANAGHQRTLLSHTFANRAPVLDRYIRMALS